MSAARILVIEDNAANLALMQYLLEAFGYTVATAKDGCAGLEAAAEHRPDLIVCDIQLPKVDGYEISRRLADDAQLHAIPRIAVTALAMVGDRDRIMSAKFHGYIAKPIVPETFVEQLEAYLEPENRVKERPACLGSATTRDIAARAKDRATLLVVDDVEANLAVLRSVLEPSGYNVITAATSAEGVAIVRANHVDLILSDLHLPGEPEYSLLTHAKNDDALRRIPFMIISSTTRSERKRDEALGLGVAKFIFRPIAPDLLVREVEACLAAAGITR